ncbi:hypothetical protein F0L68_20915 [Solihabitans fulvus]|uniref:Uncharacterized protein n=1 Tax=Solihabitans fulvus TaxID=1892852 RepID=A0A5B2X7D0_9PSEU|nr:hypothetical protein F0L68_20915 [Solihabitans fulvus]
MPGRGVAGEDRPPAAAPRLAGSDLPAVARRSRASRHRATRRRSGAAPTPPPARLSSRSRG